MTRTEKFQENRSKGNSIKLIVSLVLIFISVAPGVFAFMVEKENRAIKKLIYNYDKNADVYNLQEDVKGGRY